MGVASSVVLTKKEKNKRTILPLDERSLLLSWCLVATTITTTTLHYIPEVEKKNGIMTGMLATDNLRVNNARQPVQSRQINQYKQN